MPKSERCVSTQPRRGRLEFVGLDGEIVDVGHDSKRVDENSTLEWFLEPVATALGWPVSHISLTLNRVTVHYIHRISQRTRTKIFDLVGDSAGTKICITVYKWPAPTDFSLRPGLCLCHFGGCCCNCNAPCNRGCWGCGNNGCCRCGNCGHPCCESAEVRPNQGCPISGCRPWWAN